MPLNNEVVQKALKREAALRRLREELKEALEVLKDNRVTAAAEEAAKLTDKAEQLTPEPIQFKQDAAQTASHLSKTEKALIGVTATSAVLMLYQGDYKSAAILLAAAGATMFRGNLLHTAVYQRGAQKAGEFFAARRVTDTEHSQPVGMVCKTQP